ncbi:MAG: hypothetical protein ACREBA_07605, partial [Nitrosotalea sp.]
KSWSNMVKSLKALHGQNPTYVYTRRTSLINRQGIKILSIDARYRVQTSNTCNFYVSYVT